MQTKLTEGCQLQGSRPGIGVLKDEFTRIRPIARRGRQVPEFVPLTGENGAEFVSLLDEIGKWLLLPAA
ncbi:hypothetical protein RJT34_20317 [Clitoria ternatea]|uniref:Uncharacterized protein n=1 Tax=Clitoria ternatea TaxID=43366 RepID=A0AAN9P530_CLITE